MVTARRRDSPAKTPDSGRWRWHCPLIERKDLSRESERERAGEKAGWGRAEFRQSRSRKPRSKFPSWSRRRCVVRGEFFSTIEPMTPNKTYEIVFDVNPFLHLLISSSTLIYSWNRHKQYARTVTVTAANRLGSKFWFCFRPQYST